MDAPLLLLCYSCAAPVLLLCCSCAAPVLLLCCSFSASLLLLCCSFASPCFHATYLANRTFSLLTSSVTHGSLTVPPDVQLMPLSQVKFQVRGDVDEY